MKIRVFYPNKDGKIEFTKKQLEDLLSEVFEEGRSKGYSEGYNSSRPITITYPYTPYWYSSTSTNPCIVCSDQDSITTSTSGVVTLNNAVSTTAATFSVGDEK